MKKCVVCLGLLALAGVAAGVVAREDRKGDHGQGAGGHVVVKPDQVKWGPAPPALPPGAQAAVLAGDPRQAGAAYTVRLRLPDGYKVAPHWHPVDENVTVLQGALLMGRGEKFDPGAAEEVPAGGFAHMPRGVRHFVRAKGATVIQVHGVGPFEIHYVNPADDPRKQDSRK
jgi:quercetin dioxygenase-like cupin family protein